MKVPKTPHHGDTKNTENPVGREIRTLVKIFLTCTTGVLRERKLSHKERRQWRLSLSNYVELLLEIAAAFRVAAVAIQFNRLARTFA
jgi:hypothetical protein